MHRARSEAKLLKPKGWRVSSTSAGGAGAATAAEIVDSSVEIPAGLEPPEAVYDNAKVKSGSSSVKKGRQLMAAAVAQARKAALPTSSGFFQLLLLVLVVGLWSLHIHARYQASLPSHLVVLDAGSTGTRVHVFEYTADSSSSSSSSYAALALPEPKLKVQPGLSAYAQDPAGAAASLQPLLEFAAQHIPASRVPSTPVYLMATAGMRLLPAAAAEGILAECRSALRASSFLFSEPDWAQIISGTYEGLYAWVAANYAAGNLQAAAEHASQSRKDLQPHHISPAAFKALIEVGGASAQVTFMPLDTHWAQQHSGNKHAAASTASKQRVRLKLPGVHHPLWSHSYLGYGFDVVQNKVDHLVQQLAALHQQQNQNQGSNSSSSTDALSSSSVEAAAVPAGAGAAAASGHSNVPDQSGQLAAAAAAGTQPQPAPSEHSAGQQALLSGAVHVAAEGVMDPCLPAGYRSDDGRVGSGVWGACQQLVQAVLDPAACKPQRETPCPEVPDHVPRLTGELLAIENFAYTAAALSLPTTASLGEFAAAARQFCSRPWPQTLQAHSGQPEQQQYLWRYCFGSAFAWTLLHHVLHISEGQQLHFTNILRREDGAELGLDWALGAAVLQLANNSAAEGARLAQQRHTQQFLLFAALSATAVLAFVSAASLQAWRGSSISGKLGQQPGGAWLTVIKSGSGGGGSDGGGVGGNSSGSWSSMASSTWASGRPAYQQVRL